MNFFRKNIASLLWGGYILIFLLLIYLSFLIIKQSGFDNFTNIFNSLLLPLLAVLYTIFSPKIIKEFIEDVRAKNLFSDFGNEKINYLRGLTDNKKVLPFKKIIVKGFNKEDESLNKDNLKVYFKRDKDYNSIKSKISILLGKYALPKIENKNILDDTSLQALRLVVAQDMEKDLSVVEHIKEAIKQNSERDEKFISWFDKWKKIYYHTNRFKPQKNNFFEFIKPKFENIIKDEDKGVVGKRDEILFLIEKFYEDNISLLFIDTTSNIPLKVSFEGKEYFGYLEKNRESKSYYLKNKKGYVLVNLSEEKAKEYLKIKHKREFSNYLSKAKAILKDNPYIIISSRGFDNNLNKWLSNFLIKNRLCKTKYSLEVDDWLFNDDRKATITWNILEKM